MFQDIVAAGLANQAPFGVLEHVIPSLATQLLRAERTTLIRRSARAGGQIEDGTSGTPAR